MPHDHKYQREPEAHNYSDTSRQKKVRFLTSASLVPIVAREHGRVPKTLSSTLFAVYNRIPCLYQEGNLRKII